MTREQCSGLFPDLTTLFRYTSDSHPFWTAVADIAQGDARAGLTLLTDLEQAAAWLRNSSEATVLQEQLEQTETVGELMSSLTTLYVAYLYRNHNTRFPTRGNGHDIELEIANQLLALGVVQFTDFRPVREQLFVQGEEDVENTLQKQKKEPQQWAVDILEQIEKRAQRMTEQPHIHHHIVGVITPHTATVHEYLLSHHLKSQVDSIQRRYPHMSGIVLIDPTPTSERVVFLPFHIAHQYLEQWLQRL